MIFVDSNCLKRNGSPVDLAADISTIMYFMLKEGVLNETQLIKCFKIAKETLDEENAQKDKFREDFINKLFE